MKNTFTDDLKVGKIAEGIVLDLIHNKYPKAYLKTGYEPKYDIFIPEKNYGIEVKLDRKSRQTDNVAIECEYKGMPSGIKTTQAEFWVIIFWDKKWKYGIIKVDDLLSLCQRSDPICAGSGAMCHLIPKNVWKGACRSLGDITNNAS